MLESHEFALVAADGPDPNSMGGWCVEYQSEEFIATISQDRGGDIISVSIGSRVRHRPRGHMRGPWSLSHLRGFLDGSLDHYNFESINDQIEWLRENSKRILQSQFLNSDELNQWSVVASRRLLGDNAG